MLVPTLPVPSLSGWASTVFGFWAADVIWRYGRALKTRYSTAAVWLARSSRALSASAGGTYTRLWLSLFVLGRATDGQRTITMEGPRHEPA